MSTTKPILYIQNKIISSYRNHWISWPMSSNQKYFGSGGSFFQWKYTTSTSLIVIPEKCFINTFHETETISCVNYCMFIINKFSFLYLPSKCECISNSVVKQKLPVLAIVLASVLDMSSTCHTHCILHP